MDTFEKLYSENVRSKARNLILALPVGAIEQHGPHLPLTTDIEIPIRIASKLAEKIGATGASSTWSPLNLIVAPAVSYGARSLPQSGGGPDFAGTINIRGSILTEYLKDVIAGYISNGFRSIVILNGHYENESFIFEAIELCREQGKLEDAKVIALGWWSLVPDALVEKLFGNRFPGWHAEHASLCETSLMLHFRSDLVGSERPDNSTPPRAGVYLYPADSRKMTNRGVLGSSSYATAENGRLLCEEICSQLLALIREHMGSARSKKKGKLKKR